MKKFILGFLLASTVAVGSYVVPNLSITTGKIAALAVTRPKMAAVGQQTSSAINVSGLTSTSYADITNATVSITTTGRPVMLFFSGPTTGVCSVSFDNASSASIIVGGDIQALRGATVIGQMQMLSDGANAGTDHLRIDAPCSTFLWFDTPAAGSYTYKAQYKVFAAAPSGSNSFSMSGLLNAYEL